MRKSSSGSLPPSNKLVCIALASLGAVILALAILVVSAGCSAPVVLDKTITKLMHIEKALKLYKFNTGAYPTSEEGLKTLTITVSPFSDNHATYLSDYKDDWGHEFSYNYPPALNHDEPWDLYSFGRNGIDEQGNGDDVASWPSLSEHE